MQKKVFFNMKLNIKLIQPIACQMIADLDSSDCPEKINIQHVWLRLTKDFIQTCCADTVGLYWQK